MKNKERRKFAKALYNAKVKTEQAEQAVSVAHINLARAQDEAKRRRDVLNRAQANVDQCTRGSRAAIHQMVAGQFGEAANVSIVQTQPITGPEENEDTEE